MLVCQRDPKATAVSHSLGEGNNAEEDGEDIARGHVRFVLCLKHVGLVWEVSVMQ